VAALYVAERMRNEVVATMAAYFQQLALAAARREAARAAARHVKARRDATKASFSCASCGLHPLAAAMAAHHKDEPQAMVRAHASGHVYVAVRLHCISAGDQEGGQKEEG